MQDSPRAVRRYICPVPNHFPPEPTRTRGLSGRPAHLQGPARGASWPVPRRSNLPQPSPWSVAANGHPSPAHMRREAACLRDSRHPQPRQGGRRRSCLTCQAVPVTPVGLPLRARHRQRPLALRRSGPGGVRGLTLPGPAHQQFRRCASMRAAPPRRLAPAGEPSSPAEPDVPHPRLRSVRAPRSLRLPPARPHHARLALTPCGRRAPRRPASSGPARSLRGRRLRCAASPPTPLAYSARRPNSYASSLLDRQQWKDRSFESLTDITLLRYCHTSFLFQYFYARYSAG